jgi:hypothetical protein
MGGHDRLRQVKPFHKETHGLIIRFGATTDAAPMAASTSSALCSSSGQRLL